MGTLPETPGADATVLLGRLAEPVADAVAEMIDRARCETLVAHGLALALEGWIGLAPEESSLSDHEGGGMPTWARAFAIEAESYACRVMIDRFGR